MATSVLLVFISFILLAAAWHWRRFRRFHIASMSFLVAFDLFFPVYLYLTQDWWKRLIVDGDIFSFLLWSHLILVMVLYALYVLQIMAGRAMVQETSPDEYQYIREEHRKQFLGIIVARLLVLATGALLIVPKGVS